MRRRGLADARAPCVKLSEVSLLVSLECRVKLHFPRRAGLFGRGWSRLACYSRARVDLSRLASWSGIATCVAGVLLATCALTHVSLMKASEARASSTLTCKCGGCGFLI